MTKVGGLHESLNSIPQTRLLVSLEHSWCQLGCKDNQYHLEQIKSSNGRTLLRSSVDNPVQAMAGFAPPGPGQTTIPSHATVLAPVIAASWS